MPHNDRPGVSVGSTEGADTRQVPAADSMLPLALAILAIGGLITALASG